MNNTDWRGADWQHVKDVVDKFDEQIDLQYSKLRYLTLPELVNECQETLKTLKKARNAYICDRLLIKE